MGGHWFYSLLWSTSCFFLLHINWLRIFSWDGNVIQEWFLFLLLFVADFISFVRTAHFRQAKFLFPASEAATFPWPLALKVNMRLTLKSKSKPKWHQLPVPVCVALWLLGPHAWPPAISPGGLWSNNVSLFPAWEHISTRAFKNTQINFSLSSFHCEQRKWEVEMTIT